MTLTILLNTKVLHKYFKNITKILQKHHKSITEPTEPIAVLTYLYEIYVNFLENRSCEIETQIKIKLV